MEHYEIRWEPKVLTPDEQRRLVELFDSLQLSKQDKELLQKFLKYHEKLQYYKNITVGLYATEYPEELTIPNNNVKVVAGVELPYLFQLKF